MPLTEISIRALKPSTKERKVADSGGLYLLVHPGGSKSWRYKYRILGKEKKLALGLYPLVSLKEARCKRDDAKRQLMNGIDPAAKKQSDKRLAAFNAANTFKEVAEEWHGINKSKWTERHAHVLMRRLELHIFPDLGRRPIKEIKPIELLNTIRKIEKRKATHLSHRLLQVCKLIFRYALVTERAEYNPAADLQGALVAHREKHHPTLKPNELPKFLEALGVVETSMLNRFAVKLLLLTFMRQGELRHSKWAHIDWKAKEWHIPAENTKMRDAHIVPLSSQALALLKELKELTGWSDYLFPSQQRQKNPVMSENTINVVIKRMGYEGKIVGHGFRALASTILNEHGFNSDVIERQLAHAERNKVRAAYNRAEYLPDRGKMMQWWADYLQVAENKKTSSAKQAA
jgi:integrase